MIFPILVPYKHMFYANGPHFSFFFFFRSQEGDTDSDGLISREDQHHGGEMILTFWWKTSWDYVFWLMLDGHKIQLVWLPEKKGRPRKKTPESSLFWKMDSELWCMFVLPT